MLCGKQLMEYEYSQDGILAWIGILNQCDKGGNRDLRIQILEQEISTPYYKNYKGGLNAYLNNFETALTELSVVLMKSEFQSEESQKRKLLQNLEPLGWTWLDPVVHSIPMPEVYQMIRKIALKEEYMLKNKMNNRGKVSQANLSHVEPDVWSKLPKYLKKLIIDTRRLEKNTSPGANKPQSTSQPSAKANLEATVEEMFAEYTPGQLASIDEFINNAESEDEDSDREVSINMTHVLYDEDSSDTSVYYGPMHPLQDPLMAPLFKRQHPHHTVDPTQGDVDADAEDDSDDEAQTMPALKHRRDKHPKILWYRNVPKNTNNHGIKMYLKLQVNQCPMCMKLQMCSSGETLI